MADLRRAVSTAYYAAFQTMAKDAADLLVGVGPDRPERAWVQCYRALQHGDAKSACAQVRSLGFPTAIVASADAFVRLQEKRHAADYDPNFRISRTDANDLIDLAESAIHSLKSSPRKDRKAFAVLLLFRKR